MQVVVDSLLTHYHRLGEGRGQTIVILHGWGDSAAGWLEFAGRLADKYQVVLIDLPGFGKTDMPHTPWGLDDYAGFVAHFLQKIDVQVFAIIAHSNGGAIAVHGLAHGRLQAQKLVLLASAGVRSNYRGRKKAMRMVAKTGKVLAAPLPAPIKQRLRRKLYTTLGSDMLVAEHLQETFKRVVGYDIQADAAALRLPVLLVYGEKDVATPPSYGYALHQHIKGSTLEIVGDAEHFLHNDQPQKVFQVVNGFLA